MEVRSLGVVHPDPAPDLTACSAAEISARVRDGWVSAVDVARAHLARIAGREPGAGVFQEHDPARVLAEAAGVDSRADRFALPLAGVPIAVSDDVDVAGYPTRRGSTATSDRPARRDDELVKRLRTAGAVVIGKTRMPELGAWGFGADGGAAAAVAMRMAVAALGTDGGGAIRIPAAYRGLVGLKPGTGAVPLPAGMVEHWCGMTAAGPIARTAQDAALVFAVLRGGPESTEDSTVDRRPIRIALSMRSPLRGRWGPADRAAAVGAAARLRTAPAGATVRLADPPYPLTLVAQWTRRWRAGVARDVAALGLDAADLERRTATIARTGRWALRVAPPGPAAAWRARVLEWFDDYDLLLSPAVAGPPARAGQVRAPGLLLAAARVPYTAAWNLAGLPAVVAPVMVAGRPVGVQLVGRPGDEQKLLAAAAVLQGRAVPELVSAGGARVR